MTAPQFPAAWGQPPAQAQQPAPGYPPQQQFSQPPAQYAPPAPPQPPAPNPGMYAPQYPGQPYGMPMGYPPAPPQYDPYAQQLPPQPPAFQPAGGTLDEYMNQKPAGAQFWKFDQPGRVLIGMVERDLRDSDVAQVTFQGQPVRRKDGSISQEKTLTVPVVNQDGSKALIEFKSHQRTAFEEAVSAGTGGASRLPAGGGMIRGEFTHTEPSRGGGSPKKIIRWEYVPPGQVAQQPPAAAPVQQQAPPPPAPAQAPPQPVWNGQQWVNPPELPNGQYEQPQPVQTYPPAPQQAAPAQQYAAPPAAAAYPQAQPAPVPSPTPAGGPPLPQQFQAPPGMAPEHAAQFAGLLGGAAQ